MRAQLYLEPAPKSEGTVSFHPRFGLGIRFDNYSYLDTIDLHAFCTMSVGMLNSLEKLRSERTS